MWRMMSCARVVCGDARVAEPVLEGAHDRWVKQKRPWLGVLADLVAESVARLRTLELQKLPGVAEAISWAHSLDALSPCISGAHYRVGKMYGRLSGVSRETVSKSN